jgi:peptidyl-prolyl cis-trans isomerase C
VKTWLTLLLALAACNSQPAGGPVPGAMTDVGEKVLSVNDTPIGNKELELVFKKMRVPEDQIAEFAWTPGGKRYSEDYALATVLYKKALEDKLAEDPEVQMQLALATRQVLASAARERIAKGSVTEAAIADWYEKNKVRYEKPEVHARQIRVATEAEAVEVMTRIKGGEDFAAVAKDKSVDAATASKGGDLGWFKQQENPLGEQIFAAEKGALLGPLQGRLGWHVVEVLDKRDKTPMEEIKPEATAQIEHAEAAKAVDELRKSLKIEWVKEPAAGPPIPPQMTNPHGSPHGMRGPMEPGLAIPGGGKPVKPPAPAGGAGH